MRLKTGKIILTLLCNLIIMSSNAQDITSKKRAFTIADIYRIKSVSGVNVSPDKKEILFTKYDTEFLPAQENNTPQQQLFKRSTDIYSVSVNGNNIRQLTTNGNSYNPRWSKDGKHVFYTSLANGKPQVMMLDKENGTTKQITNFELGINEFILSPDENLIAFVAEVYPEAGADGKLNLSLMEKKSQGPIHGHVADKLLFRHWNEYNDGKYNHIIVYNIKNDKYTDITPGEYMSPTFSLSGIDDSFCFSPDSKQICFVSNRTEHQEANTNCDLWIVSVNGGEPENITSSNKAWDGSPKYSPDGRYIAYKRQAVEGYESDCFKLAVYDLQKQTHTILTESFDNWVNDFQWADNSQSIYFTGMERGYMPLFKVELKNKKIKKLIRNHAILSFAAVSDNTFFYTSSNGTGKPYEMYCMKKNKESQITHFNDDLQNEVDLRSAEAHWVIGADGDSVQYFLIKPHNFNPQKKYPVVINVHGGPQMQWQDSYRADWQVYPGAGYIVVFPNPHGSTGYGQKFTRAISGNWGTKPYEDVMAVTDDVEKLPYVDSSRIGAMGWSYGGYFMNWLQGQTKRYKCLASMMGVYDMNSMWGTTEELWFPNFEFEGQPWNSSMYKRFSPSEYVKNFSTPTLIITGERDYRVSYNQSLAYFTTLQTLNIPSRLIIFDNDGHWPSSASMLVYYNAHLEWFHKYLGGDPAPWDTEKMINNTQDYH